MFELMPMSRNERALFHHFFADGTPMERSFRLNVDVDDQGDHYELKADLPGFSKEDIAIDIEGKTLSIRAGREETKEEEKKNYVYRERFCGSFCRSFDITGIEADQIRGSFDNGVLSLVLPKEEAQRKGSRRLQLSGPAEAENPAGERKEAEASH